MDDPLTAAAQAQAGLGRRDGRLQRGAGNAWSNAWVLSLVGPPLY